MIPMGGVVVYVLLFLALYFEVFFVLAFFEGAARARRRVAPGAASPSVSILIPCHNEERTVGKTVESVLLLDYPQDSLKVVLIDDGSTDGTEAVLERLQKKDSRVSVITKQKGGKHTALNAALQVADTEFVACLDADSFVEPDALKEAMGHFDDARAGAVTSAISVYEPKSPLERMQHVEYLLGIMLRHVLAALNGIYVTPGPLTVFRKQALDDVGHFRAGHNTEDMEMALRLQKGGWRIGNAPRARVYTKAPKTVSSLIRQRTRWTTGFLRNSFDYKELIGNPRHGVLGLVILPLGIFSIYSGLVLFSLVWSEAGLNFWRFFVEASEVPFSFTFRAPSFDWFFAPVSTLALVSFVAVALMLACAYVGAAISRTKSRFGVSVFWYVLLYCLIAPFWMIRSVADVALGIRRPWHS